MRWEREWDNGKEFIAPSDYQVDSMTTVSTHDSENLRQWWLSTPSEAAFLARSKVWSYHPVLSREHHREMLWESHHTSSLFHINLLPEYLALIPGMTWHKLEDERINIPGLYSERNWSYRLRPSLEEIAGQEPLRRLMQGLI